MEDFGGDFVGAGIAVGEALAEGGGGDVFVDGLEEVDLSPLRISELA